MNIGYFFAEIGLDANEIKYESNVKNMEELVKIYD